MLKLRDRSTFGMKISKSNSAVFLVKKSKYKANLYGQELKHGIDQYMVFRSYLSPPNSKLNVSWSIGKLIQRTTTSMFCIRASLASIIEKITVESRSKVNTCMAAEFLQFAQPFFSFSQYFPAIVGKKT